jgi:hypothetical protein
MIDLKKTLILTFLLIIPVVSCTERINIDLDDSSVKLVVEGSITTDRMPQTIFLSKTTSYFDDQKAPLVSGALVTITEGSTTYFLNEVNDGVYRTEPNVRGIPGKTYKLNIRLADPVGGYTDYTASSTLQPVSPLDSIDLVFHPEWSDHGVWEVRCFVQDPPTTDFYRFIVFKNSETITDTLDEWFVADDRFINGYYSYGSTIAYLDQGSKEEGLNQGDQIIVEMNSIGEDYANFLWESQSEIRGANPLFSGPPANVKGNINNGAIGFFAAYSVTRASKKVPASKP